MIVNILYVCTGNYFSFFEDFYNSCENLFLPDCQKKYFVFTDVDTSTFKTDHNIRYIKIEKNSWPLNTLLRFSYFNIVRHEILKSNYVFFFNANALIVKEFSSALLPTERDNYLVGVVHPGYINKPSLIYPWERRINAHCRIGYFSKGTYYQGCFSGGRTAEYIELIDDCRLNTEKDLKKNLIARVHDESYLNYFFKNKKPKSLSPLYSWPEKYGSNDDAVIIMRGKEKYEWYNSIK